MVFVISAPSLAQQLHLLSEVRGRRLRIQRAASLLLQNLEQLNAGLRGLTITLKALIVQEGRGISASTTSYKARPCSYTSVQCNVFTHSWITIPSRYTMMNV